MGSFSDQIIYKPYLKKNVCQVSILISQSITLLTGVNCRCARTERERERERESGRERERIREKERKRERMRETERRETERELFQMYVNVNFDNYLIQPVSTQIFLIYYYIKFIHRGFQK